MIDATITGNITEPQLSYTGNNQPVVNFRIASTDRKLNNQSGQWEDISETLWVNVAIWDNPEDVYEELVKGQRLTVTGKLSMHRETWKDGTEHDVLRLRGARIPNIPLARPRSHAPQANTQPHGGVTSYHAPHGGSQADPWTQPQQQHFDQGNPPF